MGRHSPPHFENEWVVGSGAFVRAMCLYAREERVDWMLPWTEISCQTHFFGFTRRTKEAIEGFSRENFNFQSEEKPTISNDKCLSINQGWKIWEYSHRKFVFASAGSPREEVLGNESSFFDEKVGSEVGNFHNLKTQISSFPSIVDDENLFMWGKSNCDADSSLETRSDRQKWAGDDEFLFFSTLFNVDPVDFSHFPANATWWSCPRATVCFGIGESEKEGASDWDTPQNRTLFFFAINSSTQIETLKAIKILLPTSLRFPARVTQFSITEIKQFSFVFLFPNATFSLSLTVLSRNYPNLSRIHHGEAEKGGRENESFVFSAFTHWVSVLSTESLRHVALKSTKSQHRIITSKMFSTCNFFVFTTFLLILW